MTRTLSKDMQVIAEIIGDEAVEKLINEFGGVTVYIPKPDTYTTEEVVNMLRSCSMNVKVTASRLGLSQSKVYAILKEYREQEIEKRQLKLFDDDKY